MKRKETEIKIKEAFITLLKENAYEDITVREIASQAEIGFKTFYRYYKDKMELANIVYEELWLQFMSEVAQESDFTKPEEIILQFLIVVRKNPSLIRTIMMIGTYRLAIPQIGLGFASLQVQTYCPELFESENSYAKDLQALVTNRFLEGQFELIRWWLLENEMKLPIEILASTIYQLVSQPIQNFKMPDMPED